VDYWRYILEIGGHVKYTKVLCLCLLGGALSTVPVRAGAILPTSTAALTTYEWSNTLDTGANKYLTDYAAATFNDVAHPYGLVNLDIDLGAQLTISSILYTDRTSSGGANGVGSYGLGVFATQIEYIFSNSADFSSVLYSIVVDRTAPSSPASYLDFQTTTAIPLVTAQYVRFEILAINGAGLHPGAASLEFTDPVANPEPSTNVLLGTGILIGLLFVRRRAIQA
jgi:hypothetical protein